MTYLAARLIPAAATMGLTFLCIQWMAPQDYAVYSATMLAVAMVAGFAGGISGQPMLRYGRELARKALRTGLWSLPVATALLLAPLLAGYLGVVTGWSAVIALALLMMPLLAVMDARRSLFVAFGEARAVLALDGLRSLLALAGIAVLLVVWAPTVFAAVLAQLLAVAIPLAVVRTKAEHTQGHGTRRVDRAYLGFGLGIAGWLAAILGLSLGERAVVVSVAGLAESGRYAAQADVVNAVFAAVGGALGSAMMPAYLSQARVRDPQVWRGLTRMWQAGVAGISVLCVGAGLLLAWVPLGRVSAALTDDPVTGLLLVAAAAVWTAGGFVQKPLELQGQAHRIFLGALASLGLFALAAPPLAAAWGSAGAAAAKLLSGLGFVCLVLWWGRRTP